MGETPNNVPESSAAAAAPQSAPVVVDARDLHKIYATPEHRVTALAGITLKVAEGAFTAIMGASGSGKSTLLHLVGGLTAPTSGTVVVEGHDLSRMSDRARTVFRPAAHRRHLPGIQPASDAHGARERLAAGAR